MADGMTTASLRTGIERMAQHMAACSEELNKLDGKLGDGDIGVTVLRGSQGLAEAAPTLPADVGAALLQCAKVFTQVSGSTFGTLLATGLMAAAKQTKGREEVPWSELGGLLKQAQEAMAKRGKAAVGDKTVLDSLEAVSAAVENAGTVEELAGAAEQGAAEALDAMREQPARQGRARIFGSKSIGADDPGMVTLQRMIQGLSAQST